MNMKKIISAITAAAISASALVIPASADDTYHAGLIFQTASWMYRDHLEDDEIQGDAVPDDADTVFVDTEINGDGTYTVEIKGIPADATAWHSICLLTDIPYSEDLAVEVTAAEGITWNSANQPSFEQAGEVFKVNFINEWNDGVKDTPVFTVNEDTTDIKVTFKLTGLGTAADDNAGDNADNAGDKTDNENKPAANTGIEGVAVVAGLAVLAAGALVIAKKRK